MSMYSLETKVKNFYSTIKFPGNYTIEDLDYYDLYQNNFLKLYVDAAKQSYNILEIGCGTGYITNLIALQNKNCTIDAVDFADSIDVAKAFSLKNNIKNITYHKTNFLSFRVIKKYDLIISNGVLHHIPNLDKALDIINQYDSHRLVLGVYNTYGKLYKKLLPVKYRNTLLHADQEYAPYEVNFTHSQMLKFFPNYILKNSYPKFPLVDFKNLFNYDNGGLTIYDFIRK